MIKTPIIILSACLLSTAALADKQVAEFQPITINLTGNNPEFTYHNDTNKNYNMQVAFKSPSCNSEECLSLPLNNIKMTVTCGSQAEKTVLPPSAYVCPVNSGEALVVKFLENVPENSGIIVQTTIQAKRSFSSKNSSISSNK